MQGGLAPFFDRRFQDVGIDEFFYGGFMWLGCRTGVKRVGLVLSVFFLVCSNASYAEHPFTTENKMKIIARDLLQGSYNRVNNLPAVVDDVQMARRANVIRNIAKKATNLSLTIGKKTPLTGLAVALGVGSIADMVIDEGFQRFTGAKQDEKGFYVEVTDPNTYKSRKVYLEEEPSYYNPAYVMRSEPVDVAVWKSEFTECDNEDVNEALNCSMNAGLRTEVDEFVNNSFLSVTVRDSKIKSYSSILDKDNEKLFNVVYEIRSCLTVDTNQCDTNLSYLDIRLEKENKTVDKWKKYPLFSKDYFSKSISNSKNSPLVTEEDDLIELFKNALSLQGNNFNDEERNIIYNIYPSDLYKTYSDPSLNYEDLKDFTYSEDMFDRKGKNSSGSSSSNVVNNQTSNDKKEEIYGEPNYPELNMPTAREILDPFNKFFPTLKNFKLKTQSATCPTWSFNIWNKTFTIESHCPLLEQQRQLIQLIFSIVWGFIALRHLLTA